MTAAQQKCPEAMSMGEKYANWEHGNIAMEFTNLYKFYMLQAKFIKEAKATVEKKSAAIMKYVGRI